MSAWFAQNIPGVVLPLQFRRVAGGRSNLTFEVATQPERGTSCAGRRSAMFCPTAHDMRREYKIIAALGPAGVPVPPALGLCLDETVNGAPFYVMGFVDGIIARSEKEAEESLDRPARRHAGLALIDTLAQIHAVDPDRVGLGDLGRKDGYIGRQLRRWYANYQAARDSRGGTPRMPTSTRSTISWRLTSRNRARRTVVHGDYRLDNCIISGSGGDAGGPRLGAVHPGRPPRRPRPAARLLAGARRVLGARTLAHPRARDSRPATELQEPLRSSNRTGPEPPRFLPGVRLLEAGLHPGGRVRPLRRRCHGRRRFRLQPSIPTRSPGWARRPAKPWTADNE